MSIHAVTFWRDLTKKVCIANDIQNKDDDTQKELDDLLRRKLSNHKIRIYPFGSRIMGVAQETSDLDVFLEIDNSFNEFSDSPTPKVFQRQQLIANAFKFESNWKHIVNFGGKCPIVKVQYNPSMLECDISFSSGQTYCQNKLVMYLFELQPIARYMVIYLRGWIQSINLQEEFRSHILILMVIFFLQIHNHLPGIDRLQKNMPASVGPWVTTFHKLNLSDFLMVKIKVDEYETRKILREFFGFYATFNFSKYAICPYLGKYVERRRLDFEMPMRYIALSNRDSKFTRFETAIQDFIYLNFNKGWLIKSYQLQRFQSYCKKEVI